MHLVRFLFFTMAYQYLDLLYFKRVYRNRGEKQSDFFYLRKTLQPLIVEVLFIVFKK